MPPLPHRSSDRRRPLSRPPVARWAVALVVLAACSPPVMESGPARPAPAADVQPARSAEATWPIKTREHVDLWLHGYALLSVDSSRVPLFRRGYADQIARAKAATSTVTMLDANLEQLRAHLVEQPSLRDGQFVPLYFADWEALQRAVTLFFDSNGDPRRAGTPQAARMVGFLANVYRTPADRDWLRLFMLSLEDERTRFYDGYWRQQQAERAPVIAAVQAEWQQRAMPKLRPFLSNTRQNAGDVMLALPLGGEGRFVAGGSTENVAAVTLPETAAEADQAIFVFAHEIVGQVAQQVVDDNTSPAEKRAGAADRLQTLALVRGGAMLLQRTMPELADAYARYYVGLTGQNAGSDPMGALAIVFPLPDAVRDALGRQLDTILAGI